MARRTNEERAKALAAEKGIVLSTESDGVGGLAVEIWSYPAHLCDDAGAHVSIPSQSGWGLRTEPALWAAVLRELEQTFVYQCPPECECRREVAPYA